MASKAALWLKNLSGTFLRFPLPILAAAFVTTIWILESHTTIPAGTNISWMTVVAAVGAIFPFLILACLLAERFGKTKIQVLIAQAIPLLGSIGLYAWFMARGVDLNRYELATATLTFVMGTLTLFLARLESKHQDEASFWPFGKSLIASFLFAVLVGVGLFIGLWLGLQAVQSLFDAGRSWRYENDLYLVSWFFIAPCAFLIGIPRKDETPSDLYPKWVRTLTNFLVIPLLGLYFAILAAYVGLILYHWELPRETVVSWIILYATVTLSVSLLTYPMREKRAGWNVHRIIHLVSFAAMVPFLLLYGISIWARVADYGITVNRYAVLAFGLWLAAWTTYELWSFFRDRERLSVLFGSAIAVLAVGLFGPINAYSVAFSSQFSRLTEALTTIGAFEDGMLKEIDANSVEKARLQAINNTVTYLWNTASDQTDLFKRFGKENQAFLTPVTTATSQPRNAFMDVLFGPSWSIRLGYKSYETPAEQLSIGIRRDDAGVLPTKGFDVAVKVTYFGPRNSSSTTIDSMNVEFGTQGTMTLKRQNQTLLTTDFSQQLQTLVKINEERNWSTAEDMSFSMENDIATIGLVLDNVWLTRQTPSSPWTVTSFNGWLLYRLK